MTNDNSPKFADCGEDSPFVTFWKAINAQLVATGFPEAEYGAARAAFVAAIASVRAK